MRKIPVLLSFLIVFVSTSFGQNGWITDKEMQFKIKAPSDYTQKQIRDGSDKVLTLMSPDENVMVRVRAMPATEQFTTEILQRVFEQNMIQGAQRIMNEKGDLNGIPAQASAYTWKVDGSDAVLGIYYIVQNGFAYIVWTAVPRNLITQRSTEADGIIDSFELLSPQNNSSGSGMLGRISNSKNPEITSAQNINTTPIPSSSKVSGYVELVSDDACVEHLYPENFKLSSGEQGQSIWEDGSGVKMIVQTIFKEGTFESFMQSQTKSISNQGATVIKKEFKTISGNKIYDYDYEYGNTLFNYVAIEGNEIFYLLGFVGDKLKQTTINRHAKIALNSLKKVPCGQASYSNSGSISSPIQTATLTHYGFDFSNGKKEPGDGETIGWCPGGKNPNHSRGIWWRGTKETKYKNLGNIPLSSVSSVPSNWDNPADPLLPGITYVIKCADGYAAVKVISSNENMQNWPVEVEYKFTSGNSF